MKLAQICTPQPITMTTSLVEGVKQRDLPDGGMEYYDDPSSTTDSGDMYKRMPATRQRKKVLAKPRMTGTQNSSYSSWKEKEEFSLYQDDNKFQDRVDVYYGYGLIKGKGPEESAAYRRVLDALKNRNNRKFDPELFKKMMNQGADRTVRQIKQYESKLRRAVVIPVPSTSNLPEVWAKTLTDKLNHSGIQAEVQDVLEFNPKYKYGLSQGEDVSPAQLRKQMDIYVDIVVDEFLRGFRSEEQAMEVLFELQDWIDKALAKDPDNEILQIDNEAINRAVEEFERLTSLSPDELEQLKHQAVTERGTSPRKLHNMPGGFRRAVWDKTKMKDDASLSLDKDVAVIIADDNIESGSMVVDTYRMLYKKGIFDKQTNKVIGAVVHNLNIKQF